MDDVTETGASAAPTETAETGSPAPSETPSAPEKPSRFAALMADGEDSGEDQGDEPSTDGDGEEAAEGDEPTTEPGDEEKPEETPGLEEEDVPKDLKKILKAHPDLRAAHFYKRDLDALGLTVEEARKYREEIQSLDDLKITVDRAKALDAFENLFMHPDATAPEHFLEGLRTVDSKSADRLIQYVAKELPKVAPEAYFALGGQVFEKGLAKIEQHAGNDPFRREAVLAVKEMLEEIMGAAASDAPPRPRPLPNPDQEELEKRRAAEARNRDAFKARLGEAAFQATDREVRSLVDDVVKRADPNGLLTTPDVIQKIVNEVHRTVAASSNVKALFRAALEDDSAHPDQRIAKAAALVKARAKNVVHEVFRKETDGIKERLRHASQLKLGKAAKVVSMREATGGRPATTPAPAPRGRMTSRDIFRAAMKG